MKELIICLIFLFVICFCTINSKKKNIEALEYAYFSGQVDALRGDIRVDTTTFMWIKSPWNNGDLPIFMFGEGRIGKMAKQEMLLNK